MKRIFLLIAAIAISTANAQTATPFSSNLNKKDVVEVCNAVASWQVTNFAPTRSELDWTNAVLYKGMAQWIIVANQPQFKKFLIDIGYRNKWQVHSRIYHADDICVAQYYFDLYRLDGDTTKISAALARARFVAQNPSTAPLKKDDPIGKNDRWSWCDALFMAPPVYAAAYTLTGDKVFLNYLNSEFKACTDSLYDKDAKLFYRDNMRIPLREANGTKQFWARGNGWVFAGLPLVIDNLPENEPSRNYYIALFKEMAPSIIATQDKDGAWHASLLDPDSYPTPENSSSGFFCYGLAWGIRNGYLDAKTYREPMLRAWNSLVSYVDADGKLGYVQPVGADPRKVDRESTEVYGVGAFLLAGSEIYRIVGK